MRNSTASQKKQSKGSSGNWHRADIVAALHKRGLTLASLSRSHGLAPRTLNNALERHYPRAERIIAGLWIRHRKHYGRKGMPLKMDLIAGKGCSHGNHHH